GRRVGINHADGADGADANSTHRRRCGFEGAGYRRPPARCITGLKQCLTFLIIMSAINRMERVNGHGKESAEESRPKRTAGTRSSEQTNRSHPGGSVKFRAFDIGK